ncbi:HamA C-terminal domain-containing protein [Pseudomonas gingeri]
MKKTQNKLNFEIIVDDLFQNFNTSSGLSPTTNKYVLSLLNNFEDGTWRYSKFQNFIWDNIAETALSQRERDNLINHSLLTSAAKNLRLTDKTDEIGKGSELAEIVLYGIMKHHFNALPVVPKIFYKQNPKDNAKGADSVHIVVTDDDFTLWFGEAKFYTNIEDVSLGKIVTSVANSLKTEKLKKENSIIINVNDIDLIVSNLKITQNIKNSLCPQESIDDIKHKINIPILILHECPITKAQTELSNSYKAAVLEHQKNRTTIYFKKQIAKLQNIHKYQEIKFHIILFPVPCKKTIVDKFLSNVQHYKDQ